MKNGVVTRSNGRTCAAGRRTLYSRLRSSDKVAIEAGNMAFIIAKEIQAAIGCTVYVLNPSNLALIYASMKKTDKEDSLKLAHIIEDFQEHRLPVVPVPGEQEMKRRKILGSYRRAQQARGREINKLHALFLAQGITTVVKNDLCTVEQRKETVKMLTDLERWRRDGKAPSPEMQSFFAKFAEFLKKVANAIQGRAEVSPEIKAFFDSLYAGEQLGGVGQQQESSGGLAEANRRFNEERPSLSKNWGKNYHIRQTGVSTVQELWDKAERHIEELRTWVNGIAEKYDAHVVERPVSEKNPLPLKTVEGIQRKLDSGLVITDILDIMGATIVVKDLQTLVSVTEELRRRNDVVRIKDRFKENNKPKDSGYKDILTNVRLSDRMIAEVQVNVEQMLAAKDGDGHKLYQIARLLKNEVKEGRLTKQQAINDKRFLEGISRNYYNAALQAVYEASHSNASSLDTVLPSANAIDASNIDNVSDLSSFTLNKFQELGLSANNASAFPSPSMSINRSEGSSNDGTSTNSPSAAETRETELSTGAAEAETTDSSFIVEPSTTNIADNSVAVNSKENERRIKIARNRWEAADRTRGYEDQITLQTGEVLEGYYEMGEAGISTPSVNPDSNFTKSDGFPVNENGTSMNVGRDYTGGFSQEAAVRMAGDFDQRGLGIIVDSNGVTSSGNNRDISRRIAAANGTDGKYTGYLKSNPARWGFTQADIAQYKHPTLYFVVPAPDVYTPLYFDQFNRSGKKSVSPIETAIKMSYLLKSDSDMVREFSNTLGEYESIADLYEDTHAATGIFQSLMKRGIVTANSYPDYIESATVKGEQQERVTSGGRDFLESVMLGAVLNEDSIRLLASVTEIRKRIIKGLASMVDNAALGGHSVISEINAAIGIAVEVQTNKKQYKGIKDYADQRELSLGQRVSTDIEIELAGRLLERAEYGFADMMSGLNAVLQEEARGQSDMFAGESKDDILRRYLGIKAQVDVVRAANNEAIENAATPAMEKAAAAMDNAGLAKGEADGTLFQAVYHGSPHRFERFDSAHMGSGEGAQTYGWGLYFASKKEVAEWYYKQLSNTTLLLTDLSNVESARRILSLVKDSGLQKNIKERLHEEAGQDRKIHVDDVASYITALGETADIDGLFKTISHHVGSDEKAKSLFKKNDLEYKPGQLYEVDIPSDELMLDWDKQFGEQPQQVKERLEKLFYSKLSDSFSAVPSQYSGEKIYGELVHEGRMAGAENPEQEASAMLTQYGIKGIRYLDGSSRSGGEGSYNYVIFDGGDVNITQTFFQFDDRGDEGKTAEVINIDPNKILDENGKKIDLKNTRALTSWVRKHYQGRKITISDDGLRLSLTRSGMESGTKRRGEQQRQMFAELDRLIETAVYGDFEAGNAAHPKVEKQNIYYSAARIGTQLFSVRIKIDIPADKTNPNYYKDHKITEIKIEPSLYEGSSVTGPSFQNESSINRVSLAVLKGVVKPSSIENRTLFQLYDRGDDGKITEIKIEPSLYEGQSVAGGPFQNESSINRVSLAVLKGVVKPSSIENRTLFQHDEKAHDSQLVEEAAQYGSWQEFRDAYEGKSRAILNGKPVASVKPDDVPIIAGKPVDTAMAWINKNPVGTVKTEIGDVEVTAEGVYNSLWHTKYANKVYVLPAMKAILQDGAFLSAIDDFNPENNIRNYYFAAPVKLNEERKIVFIRVRQREEGSKDLYVHEVFTEVEVRAAAPLQEEIGKRKPEDGSIAAAIPGNQSVDGQYADTRLRDKTRNQSDLYRSIVNNILTVNATGERATDAWYRSLWNDARKIHDDPLFQEEAPAGRAEALDKRFADDASREYLTDALKTIHAIMNDRTLPPAEGESRVEYDRIRRLQERIRRELPSAGSVIGMAAQVNSGRALSSSQYDRLRRVIRQSPREFRAVFADVMGQVEYLEHLAGTADGEPNARLADPRMARQDTQERLREIAREIGDPALAAAIESGEITFDDPRITAFEKGQEVEYRHTSEAMQALEAEMGEDFARLANNAQRRMVRLYEDLLAAKERMTGGKDRLARMTEEGLSIAGSYRRQANLETADYERAYRAFDDFSRTQGIEADVREALARRDAQAQERTRQQGLNKRRRAVQALKQIKKNVVKRITRNAPDTINHNQREVIKTIQRIFEPSILDGVNKWIGGAQGPLLREVWSQWSTDEQYRQRLMEEAGEGKAGKIADILDKNWDFVTTADKKALVRLLPKKDFVRDLALEELIQENEESIQLDIDERVINGRVYHILGTALEQKVKDAVGGDLYSRMKNKPLGEWSILEAEELARAVDRLTVEGRREMATRREAKYQLERHYRDQLLQAVRKSGLEVSDDDTPQERKRKEDEQQRVLHKYARGDKRNSFLNNFFDGNLRRFTTAMDGGRKGIFTSLLYWGENDAYNARERHIAVRRMVIDKAMKENNITLDELFKDVSKEIHGLEGTDLYRTGKGRLTVDDLLYILRGYRNEETRRAIMYGNLSNASERAYYKNRMDNPQDSNAFEVTAHTRLMNIVSFANNFFAQEENQKFKKLEEAIGEDYDANGERLNSVMIEMFNRPMWRVQDYVPMNRQEQSGTVNENRILEDLLGTEGAGQKWVNRGFSNKRIVISPYGQAPIELGLYKTWAKSVTETEHFVAYGPLVQTLNAVFKGYETGELRQALGDRWGEAAIKRIGDTIAEFAKPDPTRQRTELDNFIRALRGKTATAFLAWKTSGILLQTVTSPWPYLQEISPAHYLPACMEVAGGFGRINEFIKEKSIFMKNREFDPMIKLIKEQMVKNENRVIAGIDKFNTLGMKGLEWIDWACVAPGWLAVYRKELVNVAKEQEAEYQKLLEMYSKSEWSDVLPTQESKTSRALSEVMNEAQQDAEAVARADDAVRRMQPSSRAVDLAPLYKNRNEIVSAVLQFQVSLNVIWQNIRYDLPLAIREKRLQSAVGMVTGYMMAGIGLGLLFDSDGEEQKEERDWGTWILYHGLTQFIEGIPVIGFFTSDRMERMITGEGRFGSSGIFPVVERALGAATSFSAALREDDQDSRQQRLTRATVNMFGAVGISLGLPVSGINQALRSIGVGDGDGEFDFYPEALLGRWKR